MDPLPEPKMPPAEIERLKKAYTDLLGFVPPRFAARADLMSRLDPEGLAVQEEMRRHFMNPQCFDAKTSQLMLFGILLANLQDAAKIHGVAARGVGARGRDAVNSRYRGAARLAMLAVGVLLWGLGARVVAQAPENSALPEVN